MQNSRIGLEYSKVLYDAYCDWWRHLLSSPEKIKDTVADIELTYKNFLSYFTGKLLNTRRPECALYQITDHRFTNKMWQQMFPFNLYSQLFLGNEHILNELSHNVPGVNPHHEHLVNFTLRQIMDTLSPSNFPLTNPVVIQTAFEQCGMNFIKGYLNYLEDVVHHLNKEPEVGTEKFQVGVNIALTKGKVVYRNKLIELIQYTPMTKSVYTEPILIVPACIMKYYILDLSPHNSMVKFLVENGHTVFMISWKNPDSNDRNLDLNDYVEYGVMNAIDVINNIVPNKKVHCAGYCIGGTILMLAAALMAQDSDTRVKSLTLFAAQVDFKDAGELLLFIDEDQISSLEKTTQEVGYLSGEQMASCFSMLHAKDLIWSKYVQDYMLGQREHLSDMMAWNGDTTRLPYKMHSEYLRKLYLNNELSQGKFKLNGKLLNLDKITTDMFVVSTVKDHVAPWKSVYKIHNFTNADITYVLTEGGHNSGIINAPGSLDSAYKIMKHKHNDVICDPDLWQNRAQSHVGSWWIAWQKWLANFSKQSEVLPKMGSNTYKVICNSPGEYVLQR